MQPVGQHEHGIRLAELARLFVAPQLINRIERLELNARLFVQRFERNARVHLGHGGFGAQIAVTDHVAHEISRFVDERVIHAPGVDSHGAGNFTELLRPFQPVQHFPEQPLCVPGQPVSRPLRKIGKAVNLFEYELSVLQTAEDVPPGRRADIDRQKSIHLFPPRLSYHIPPNLSICFRKVDKQSFLCHNISKFNHKRTRICLVTNDRKQF